MSKLNLKNPCVTTAIKIMKELGVSIRTPHVYKSTVTVVALMIRDELLIKELDEITNRIQKTKSLQYPLTY